MIIGCLFFFPFIETTIVFLFLTFLILYVIFLQSAKGAKIYSAAAAAAIDGQLVKEGDEKIKLHTHSYCCLDYAQVGFLYIYLNSQYFFSSLCDCLI